MGLPFIAVRGLLGSDILTYRPDLLAVDNPFDPGEEVVVARPLRPDVAAFHALRADRWGNAVTPGLRDDLIMARAAHLAVVTTEEIVEGELGPGDAVSNTFLPAIDVDLVVRAPRGAHPGACRPLYEQDEAHCREYVKAARDEHTFQAYLERYVHGVRNHQEYLERVGLTAVAHKGGE